MAGEQKVKGAKTVKASGNGFIKYLTGMKAEFKRITWASKEDTKKAAITVLIFCLIYVVFIAIFDFGFSSLFKIIFKS